MEEIAMPFEPGPANPQPFSAGIHTVPSFDVIDALASAPAGADKMRMLRQRSNDGNALIPKFEDLREASMKRIDAENTHRRLISHPQDGGFGLKPDDRRVIAAEKHLEKMTADFKRLQELQEVRSAAWQTASAALANVENWLRHGVPGNCKLEAVEVEQPKLLKNEGLLDGVDRFRRRGREVKAAIHTIQSSCYPRSFACAEIRREVETLAVRGTPVVSDVIEHAGKIVWPMQRVTSEVIGAEQRARAFTEIPDTLALFAFVHKDALLAVLDALIDAEADDAASLSHEERQRREAEALGDLLDIERQEAALVWQAQAQGLPVEHRADISPLALLGLQLVSAPRAAPPPTSPEHAYDIVRR
jgi:hypothetical protein